MKIQVYMILSFSLVTCRQYLMIMNSELDVEWEVWKEENNKSYMCEEEESRRRENWEQNRLFIQEENEKGNLFQLKSNQFADLVMAEINQHYNANTFSRSDEEFLKSYLTHSEFEPEYSDNSSIVEYKGELPNSVDWRENGMVTPVKDQGACGSCYAFSATGALEAQYKLQYGELVSFSEQQVVDCSGEYGNWHCAGGWIVNVFAYWQRFKAELSDDYPYYGELGRCQYLSENGKTNVLAYRTLPRSKTELAKALAGVGPVSIALDASSQSFHFYSSGVYQDSQCSSRKSTHAMLVVGYGTWNGVEYWLVKNSWGKGWGEEGYMRIAKGDNMCGILTHASFPVIST